MAQMMHNGGIVEAVLELGFDAVKYFEITASGTAQMLSISPPAKRIILLNSDSSTAVYFNITGTAATTSVSSVPGDNIKIGPGCTFSMDFDSVSQISFITTSAGVSVEGILGWKATVCN